MQPTNKMEEEKVLCDKWLKEISGGEVINRDTLEEYIRKMKAIGHSKAAVVGMVVSFPQVGDFCTDPRADMESLLPWHRSSMIRPEFRSGIIRVHSGLSVIVL